MWEWALENVCSRPPPSRAGVLSSLEYSFPSPLFMLTLTKYISCFVELAGRESIQLHLIAVLTSGWGPGGGIPFWGGNRNNILFG